MALWLIRAGRHGEHEQKFLDENRIYLTWGQLTHDLNQCKDRTDLNQLLEQTYPNDAAGKIRNNSGQIWSFVKRMKPGDWFALPSKHKPAINIGEITSDYRYNPHAANPYYHYREVRWIEKDIPRSNFDQDILYSLGAFMTVCQIKRNDAENRIRKMSSNGWKSTINVKLTDDSAIDEGDYSDLEQVARDQLAKLILAKFQGHGMARLVNAILEAQGYVTFLSPEGPDKGIDILAAPAPMGFGEPRICVQVKSGDAPLDRPTLDQLIGTMQNVQAQHGLLVSWGGFKSTVDKEKAVQFFRVRLWDQNDLIHHLLEHYEELDDEIRAELPLKRVWVPALSDTNTE